MSKLITPENLADVKMSDLVESVLDDLDYVKDMGYGLDMSSFIDTKECTVCLGGAAVCGFMPKKEIKKLSKRGSTKLANLTNMISRKHSDALYQMAQMFDNLRMLDINGAIYHYEVFSNFLVEDSGLVAHEIEEIIDTEGIPKFSFTIDAEELKLLKKYLKIVVRVLRKYHS
jgi:hypothetical protein